MQSSSIKETKNTIAALVLVLREEGSVKRNECSCLFQLLMPRTLSTLWLRISAQAKMRLKYKQIRQTVVIRLRAWPEVLNVTVSFLPFSTYPLSSSCYLFLLHTPLWGLQSSAVYKTFQPALSLFTVLSAAKSGLIFLEVMSLEILSVIVSIFALSGLCLSIFLVVPTSFPFYHPHPWILRKLYLHQRSHILSVSWQCLHVVTVFQLISPQSHNPGAINILICPHRLMWLTCLDSHHCFIIIPCCSGKGSLPDILKETDHLHTLTITVHQRKQISLHYSLWYSINHCLSKELKCFKNNSVVYFGSHMCCTKPHIDTFYNWVKKNLIQWCLAWSVLLFWIKQCTKL